MNIMKSGCVRWTSSDRPLRNDGDASFWARARLENNQVVHWTPQKTRSLWTGVSADDLMFYCRYQDKPQAMTERVVRSDTIDRSVCPPMVPPVISRRSTSAEEEPLFDDNPLVVRSAKLRMLGQLVELVKADAQGRSPAVPIDDLDLEQVAKLPKAERDARDRRFDRLNGRGKEGVTTRLRKQFGGKQDHWEALFDEIFGLVRAEIPTKGRPSEATRVKMEQVAEEWIERLAA
ncbi:hypothetical protein ACVWXN_002692 [Bradyrhizobium sp. i1.4.4]